jgi:hypothetical protein
MTHDGGGAVYKNPLFAGLLLVVPGIASLVVPIPHSETQGIKVGDTNIGLQTNHRERVSPIISPVQIAGGTALTIVGARNRMSARICDGRPSGFPERPRITA